MLTLLLPLLLCQGCRQPDTADVRSLSGTWQFAADPGDLGIAGRWYLRDLDEQVVLPGSMASNGKGEEISLATRWTGQIVDSSFFKIPVYAPWRKAENFKVPFWLQPLKQYAGVAWYRKEIFIPAKWKGRTIHLFLERCHWESRLWVDDQEAGMGNSLGTPHQYDLTRWLTPGKHHLTLRIDNRIGEIDPGINSHSISDHTQTNWNGITGRICLMTRAPVFIRTLQLYPAVAEKKVLSRIRLSNSTEKRTSIKLQLSACGATQPPACSLETAIPPGDTLVEIVYPMGEDVKLWNEFHPCLYQMAALLTNQRSRETDSCRASFGMREIGVHDGQLHMNGVPIFLRGTLECAVFPKTGYPPTDKEAWLRIFTVCRNHGLNHMRFHSWCPPEAAFSAADETGFYLQAECSSWANQSSSLGDGKPIDPYIYAESERMVEAYGNHPSFCILAYGNEPRGRNQHTFLTGFVTHWKEKDNRRLCLSAAGWPNLAVNDFLSMSEPRIQRWGEECNSIINSAPPSTGFDWSERIAGLTQPVVSHEIGQWCVYPDFSEIPAYDGVLRARNFEIFRETLRSYGMEQLAGSFLRASGKLQALCYKADIEAALRTPGFGGFQLLGLTDFPGQGTALVGVLNAFWEEKGYISPGEYRRFCNSTVPLARMTKLVFTNAETFEAAIGIAHFGEQSLTHCIPQWRITRSNGETLAGGTLPGRVIPVGNRTGLGRVSFPLQDLREAEKLTLEVTVDRFCNSWDFWVYPQHPPGIPGEEKVRIVQFPDAGTLEFLRSGGSVLLSLKKGTLSPEAGGTIKTGFSPIFWNTAWTGGQGPHTLGILCDPQHPALARFPSEYHSNWQWQDAMSHAGAVDLRLFPAQLTPIVRIIDDWFTNRPLALIFEAKVGKGKLLVCASDLVTGSRNRPEARQLLYSLKSYMTSPQFNPPVEVTPETVARLVH